MNKQSFFNISTLLMICFHFIVCGFPVLLIILGSILGIYMDNPLHGYISHQKMLIILIASGVMLVFSVVLYIRDCDCNSAKMKRANKTALIIAGVLYSIAVTGHLLPMSSILSISNSTEVQSHSCH